MKVNKRNIIWSILLCTVVAFGQKQTKNINESFKVNKDVLVEVDTKHSDVTVETWNKNIVSIQGVWEIEGMTKDEASKYFEGWDFEALGNKSKVVITSKSSNNYYGHYAVFDDLDLDFDMESISHMGDYFDGDYFSNISVVPPIPPVPPMSPLPPMPPFPAPVIENLTEMEFDYEAYQKDQEGYMKEFEKRQEVWGKEFEEKYAPKMKAYEKKMEEWQEKAEPQMKAYEEKMKKWEEENAPRMKEYEKKMEVQAKKMEVQAKKMEKKMKQIEKEIEVKYAKKIKERETKMSKYKIKKSLVIKVPSGATLKMNSRYGKISLPDQIKTID